MTRNYFRYVNAATVLLVLLYSCGGTDTNQMMEGDAAQQRM